MKPNLEEVARFERCLLPHCQSGRGPGRDHDPPPLFIGRYNQRGFGFGSILSGIARNILLPAVKFLGKTTAHSLRKRALKTGADLTKDILLERKGIKKSLKEHSKKLARGVVEDILTPNQRGRGQRKRKNRDSDGEDDIFSKKPRKISDVFLP